MKKRCAICKRYFDANRSWQKYCSDKCKKKGAADRVKKHRKTHTQAKMKTLYQMKTEEPYKTNYRKITTALFSASKLEEKATLSYLAKKADLSRSTLSKYLKNLRILKVVKLDDNGFSLSKNYKFEPLKLYYDALIKSTDMEYIYPGLEYMLLLPENLTAKEFLQKGRTVLFEEVFDRFFYSVSMILLDARLEKAKDIWEIKINSNMDIYPPLKLHLWTVILTSQIIRYSPLSGRANTYDDEPALKEKIQKIKQSLYQLIFIDFCNAFSYFPKDKKKRKAKIKKTNARMQTDFKVNAESINNVWNEICGIIKEKEFGVVISQAAFLKPSPDLSEGFKWLLKEKEKHGTVKVQRIGKKRLIHKTTKKELFEENTNKGVDNYIPMDSLVFRVSDAEEIGIGIGKHWFNNHFSKYTQEELRKLYIDLGYSEDNFYQVLGLFTFPIPILVMPAWGEKK